MGYPAPVKSGARNRVIVNGLAGNQRVRVALRQRQQFGDIFNGVLTVRIHLHGVGVTRPRALLQPSDDRGTFSGVLRQTNQRHLRLLRRQALKLPTGDCVAAVIHYHARQAERRET